MKCERCQHSIEEQDPALCLDCHSAELDESGDDGWDEVANVLTAAELIRERADRQRLLGRISREAAAELEELAEQIEAGP